MARPDQRAAGEQRLVAERIGVGHAVDFERDEAMRHAGCQLPRERRLADELALVHAHEAVESRLERRVVGREVGAPHPVRLLDAQRLHRAHADHADAELAAGGEERVEEAVRVLDREVQLPAQLADEVDAQRVDVGGEARPRSPGR